MSPLGVSDWLVLGQEARFRGKSGEITVQNRK